MDVVIGWDIGGVHLKAARVEDGRVTKAAQYASPLRSGTERLLQAFSEARKEIGRADRNIVTMTGELADTFSSRKEGVEHFATLAARELGSVSIYAGPAGCVRPQDAHKHTADIASANWHACAALIARKCTNALFIDLGSTTTDIVPIFEGKVAARGYTDSQRLAAGELVYSGLVRGFVMATAGRAPLRGTWIPLINENLVIDVEPLADDLVRETLAKLNCCWISGSNWFQPACLEVFETHIHMNLPQIRNIW